MENKQLASTTSIKKKKEEAGPGRVVRKSLGEVE